MIRVLHVLGTLGAGGVETRTIEIYRAIDKSKIQFDFAIHDKNDCFYCREAIKKGARVHQFFKLNGLNYFKYRNQWSVFFREHNDIDIVHAHMTTTSFIYLNIAKKSGIKIRISHARNSRKSNYLKTLIARLSRFYSTDLIAVSRKAAISEFGVKNTLNRVRILPNFLDYQKYKYSAIARDKIRNEYDLNSSNKLLVTVGSFTRQKNHRFLIDIFKHLNHQSHYKLILIGNGPLENKIRKYVIKSGLTKNIIFRGIDSNVEDVLSAADLMILPSFYEGLPGVILEAQVNGLPSLISSKITNEVKITNLVEFLDLSLGAKKWSEYIINKSMSRVINNRKIDDKFDINTQVDIYEEIYNKEFK